MHSDQRRGFPASEVKLGCNQITDNGAASFAFSLLCVHAVASVVWLVGAPLPHSRGGGAAGPSGMGFTCFERLMWRLERQRPSRCRVT